EERGRTLLLGDPVCEGRRPANWRQATVTLGLSGKEQRRRKRNGARDCRVRRFFWPRSEPRVDFKRPREAGVAQCRAFKSRAGVSGVPARPARLNVAPFKNV